MILGCLCLSQHNTQDKQLPKLTIPEASKKRGTFTHTTRFTSYLFHFDTKHMEHIQHGTQIVISKCSLSGLDNAYKTTLNNCFHEDNYYVVCPVYTSKSTKKMLDTQLSVTGKCYKNENDVLATIREIQEELGITTNVNKVRRCGIKKTGLKIETSFVADVSDSRHFDPKYDIIPHGKDDKTKKIQVVVCGKIENLLNMYANVFNRPESNDLETIRFVRIMSLKEFI